MLPSWPSTASSSAREAAGNTAGIAIAGRMLELRAISHACVLPCHRHNTQGGRSGEGCTPVTRLAGQGPGRRAKTGKEAIWSSHTQHCHRMGCLKPQAISHACPSHCHCKTSRGRSGGRTPEVSETMVTWAYMEGRDMERAKWVQSHMTLLHGLPGLVLRGYVTTHCQLRMHPLARADAAHLKQI